MKLATAILVAVIALPAAVQAANAARPAAAARPRGVRPAAAHAAVGGEAAGRAAAGKAPLAGLEKLVPDIQTRGGVSTAIEWIALLTVLSVAPAIAVLITCFTRIIVVLGLLRQALATPQIPPNSILFGLALFMTLVVMAPVYGDVNRTALTPYMEGRISRNQAFDAAQTRVRAFMIGQIEAGGNSSDVYMFLSGKLAGQKDLKWGDVPTLALIPAYVVSELKIAFFMGFRIYLPFLIVDILVASVLISMGMLMLPPVLISLPFKLLLFVLADGWHLVVGTLMKSFT